MSEQNQNPKVDNDPKDSKKNSNKKFDNPFGIDPMNNQKPKFNAYWVYGILIAAFLFIEFFQWGQGPQEIFMKDLKIMLASKDVDKIEVVNKEEAQVYLKPNRIQKYSKLLEQGINKVPKNGPQFKLQIGDVNAFKEDVDNSQKDCAPGDMVYISYKTEKNYFYDILSFILPLLIILAIWGFIYRRMSGGGAAGGGGGGANIFNVGKSRAKVFDKEASVNINFNDVAGLEEAKVELKEIVDFLKTPKKYTELGGKIPRGALLVGPSGNRKNITGKSSCR